MTFDTQKQTILAVDLGLRMGLAQYAFDGRLLKYRSTHFGTFKSFKKGVPGIFRALAPIHHVVVEGDRNLGDVWKKWAHLSGADFKTVSAEEWRGQLLPPRKQKNRKLAKQEADFLARKIIDWSELKRPISLRHDAAEAILIGLWAVLELSWLDSNPLRQ